MNQQDADRLTKKWENLLGNESYRRELAARPWKEQSNYFKNLTNDSLKDSPWYKYADRFIKSGYCAYDPYYNSYYSNPWISVQPMPSPIGGIAFYNPRYTNNIKHNFTNDYPDKLNNQTISDKPMPTNGLNKEFHDYEQMEEYPEIKNHFCDDVTSTSAEIKPDWDFAPGTRVTIESVSFGTVLNRRGEDGRILISWDHFPGETPAPPYSPGYMTEVPKSLLAADCVPCGGMFGKHKLGCPVNRKNDHGA